MCGMCKTILMLLLIGTACNLAAQQASPATKPPTQQSKLKFTVPAGWVDEERTSSMRVAQYRLPKAEGDNEDASAVLYYFGQRQGGSATANVERWIRQMQQPEGNAKEPLTQKLESNGLQITTVDVAGTYVAESSPGSGQFLNKPGFRLLAAVIETPAGSYYVKLVGPENTVAKWNDSFTSYVKSFKFE